MKTAITTVAVLLYVVAVSDRWMDVRAQSPIPASAQTNAPVASAPQVSSQRALIDQYCMSCHSDRLKTGGLALSTLNLDAPTATDASAEVAEKVIRKLRGGLMPPASTTKRPD